MIEVKHKEWKPTSIYHARDYVKHLQKTKSITEIESGYLRGITVRELFRRKYELQGHRVSK